MLTPEPHPDLPAAYHALKQIKKGAMQAIEDKAIEAYHKTLDEGKGREEAEKVFFSFFNKQSHDRK